MGSADVAGVDLAALMAAHGFQDSVAWALTGTGISIAGAPAAGSGGQLVTVRTIWSKFGVSAGRWAESFRIPVELIVATIATESRGDPAALRLEPDYADDDKTPDKVSPGLMQTLISTARDVLKQDDIDRAWLLQPDNSIQAGTACIDRQRRLTLLDPPQVACAYNAGGLYHDPSAANRWKIGNSRSAARRMAAAPARGRCSRRRAATCGRRAIWRRSTSRAPRCAMWRC
jgi:hypothetical protein